MYDGHPGYHLTDDSLRTQAIKSRIDFTEPGNWIPLLCFEKFDTAPDGSEKLAALRRHPLTADLVQDVIHLLADLLLVWLFSHFSRASSFVEKMSPTAPPKYTNSLIRAIKNSK